MKYRVFIETLSRKRTHENSSQRSPSDSGAIKISSILKILYLPAGIFVYKSIKPYSFAYLFVLYILFVFNTLGAMVTIDNEKTQPLENLYFTSSGCIVIISLLIGRYHEDYLWYLYEQVKMYQKSAEFAYLANRMIRHRIKHLFGAFFALICLIIAVPLYAVLFTEARTDDFIVLIYPMWYPWKRDTMQKYFCSLVLQLMSILYAYYLLSFVVGSFVCASLFIYIRYSMLECKIRTMEDTIVERSSFPALTADFVHHSRRQMNFKFVEIIKEHQDLIRFTKRTVSCFTLLASILVTYATIAAVLLITLFLKKNVGMLLKIKLASTSVVAMIALVVCCICGEILLNVNRKLMDAIYDKSWYTYAISLRRLIVTFMMQNQVQFEMRLFDMFPLCVLYIAEAFKLLYTCIQFLRRQEQLSN